MTLSLEERVKRLEDITDIMKLQAVYGDLVDKGWNGRRIFASEAADLFVEDCVWECKEVAAYARGREQIAAVFGQMNNAIDFYLHSFVNPIIDIDGDMARANWRLVVGDEIQGQYNLTYGNEQIEYVRTEAGWRFKSVRLNVARVVPL